MLYDKLKGVHIYARSKCDDNLLGTNQECIDDYYPTILERKSNCFVPHCGIK